MGLGKMHIYKAILYIKELLKYRLQINILLVHLIRIVLYKNCVKLFHGLTDSKNIQGRRLTSEDL